MSEIWRKVPRHPGYLVSNLGRVKNKSGKILKLSSSRGGYLHAVTGRGSRRDRAYFKVHREVARLFVPNPLGLLHVNHKSLDKTNNASLNLEWTTLQENIAHAVKAGKYAKKLSRNKVLEIRANKAGETNYQLASRLEVSVSCIEKVKGRVSWSHV